MLILSFSYFLPSFPLPLPFAVFFSLPPSFFLLFFGAKTKKEGSLASTLMLRNGVTNSPISVKFGILWFLI